MKKTFLPFLLLVSVCGSAQKASNKLSFQKGQTIEVTTTMNMTTQSQMGEMPMTIVSTEQYAVGEAGAGQFQLIKTPKRIRFNASMMGQEMGVDSDKPGDLEGQFGGPIKEMMKQKQEFTVDATGKVVSVKADDKKKKPEDAGMMGMMMPGMSAGNGVPVVGGPSFFKILPDRDVVKGESWTDSANADGNTSRTVYTVKDITDSEILLDYAGDVETKTTQSAMGQTADVNTNGKVTGTITLDKATGLLKQKTMTSDTEANVSVGGQQMSMRTKTTSVSTVKNL